MQCIHYTATPWQLAPIAVANSQHSKPVGGLWASPVDSAWGWADWCREQDFRLERLAVGIQLEISLDRAIVINSSADLGQLDWAGDYPDWESMAERGVDVVYLTLDGLRSTASPMLGIREQLYGWDCESLVVLNLRAIGETP